MPVTAHCKHVITSTCLNYYTSIDLPHLYPCVFINSLMRFSQRYLPYKLTNSVTLENEISS